MKYGLLKLVIIVLLIAAAITAFFYTKPVKNKPVAAATFYYYPKPNVYYNTGDNTYTFWDANNTIWVTDKILPDSLINDLDKKVVLHNPPVPVWKNNEKHRLLYAVQFYAAPSDFKEKPVVQNKDTIKTVKEQQTEMKPPHQSGFKRFLKKLFKKKDKS